MQKGFNKQTEPEQGTMSIQTHTIHSKTDKEQRKLINQKTTKNYKKQEHNRATCKLKDHNTKHREQTGMTVTGLIKS